jgi:hypothetical protein
MRVVQKAIFVTNSAFHSWISTSFGRFICSDPFELIQSVRIRIEDAKFLQAVVFK